MSKKVAVILSGCGVYDGAEIHDHAWMRPADAIDHAAGGAAE